MKLTLTEHELRDPLWLKIEKYMQERLARLRESNDRDMTELATAKLRGRVSMLKELIAIGNPKAPPEPD